MWPVASPGLDAGDTYALCISRVKEPLRARLQGIRPLIEAAAQDYEVKAQAAELYLVHATHGVGGTVTTAEMTAVYDQRMARLKSSGRPAYDRLMLLPDGDRCPFCDQRNVSTLDHVLPKASFPALAVTPINLVASCFECNKAKTTHIPTEAGDAFLHPYYDDINAETWLKAQVVEIVPCALLFRLVPPAAWDAVLRQRAQTQFDLLNLGKLYASEAARELSNIRQNLGRHFNAGGAEAVRAELLRQWESRRDNRLNAWQTAAYEALAHNEWFCDGGFTID